MPQGNPKLPTLNQFNQKLSKDINENARRSSEEYKVKKEVRSKSERNISPNSGEIKLENEVETIQEAHANENDNKKSEQRKLTKQLLYELFNWKWIRKWHGKIIKIIV